MALLAVATPFSDGGSSSILLRGQERVLVILTGALGDVARGIVVPTQLKRWFPDLHISWLVEDKWREVIELCPSVDEIVCYSRKGRLFGFPGVRNALRRSGAFDIALDLGRHFKSGCFTAFSQAPRRVGFHRENAKEGNSIFQTHTIPPVSDTESKVLHYEKFVRFIVGDQYVSPIQKEYFDLDTRRAEESALTLLSSLSSPSIRMKEGKLIVLSLGSSWSSKDWPLGGYDELLRKLRQHANYVVVLTGDKSQVRYGKFLESAGEGNVYNLTGRTSLRELIGVLSLSSLACGPDTGTGHLASLVNTPYVGLFGPTDPMRVAPFGSEQLVLHSLVPCRPCKRRICPGLNNACMRLITPIMVYERMLSVLQTSQRPAFRILGG